MSFMYFLRTLLSTSCISTPLMKLVLYWSSFDLVRGRRVWEKDGKDNSDEDVT